MATKPLDKPSIAEFTTAAQDYQTATGIPCMFLPLDAVPDYSEKLEQRCPICSSLPDAGTHEALHRFAAYQSERFGGKYFYLCESHLLYCASPVFLQGLLCGALVAGPTLLFEPDTGFLQDLGQVHGLSADAVAALIPHLESIPILSTTRANSLGKLLSLSARDCSRDSEYQVQLDEEAYLHQSRISEYIHHIKSMEGDKRSDLEYPIQKEKELLERTSSGDREGAKAVLDELLGVIFYDTGVELEMIKSRVLELVVLLSRAAIDGGADVEQIFGLNYRYLSRIHTISSLDELTQWTTRIINRFTDLVFTLQPVRHTHAIREAIRFIHKNYQTKVTQQDTAEAAGLSPAYFSKLFKLETNTTFTEYLASKRVEEAKRLLRTTSLTLGDIAFECGFEDQSYFTKVFTRLVGTSPSSFRQTTLRVRG